MADLHYAEETESLLVDYKPMANTSRAEYNSNATPSSSRDGSLAHRSLNGSTLSDDELLDVVMPVTLETTAGFANRDMDAERIQSKYLFLLT